LRGAPPENGAAGAVRGQAFDAAFWGKVFITLVPPLALIFLVLGSIIAGIATVNQAGAIGAAGAMIMAGYRLAKAAAAPTSRRCSRSER
jgi:TRAP-type mannitol/chloroaromatic compound transport system permease large subunit